MSFSLLSWNYVILLRIFIFQTFFQSRILSTSHYTLVVFQPTISNEIWWTKKMLDGKQLTKKTTTQTKRLRQKLGRQTNRSRHKQDIVKWAAFQALIIIIRITAWKLFLSFFSLSLSYSSCFSFCLSTVCY